MALTQRGRACQQYFGTDISGGTDPQLVAFGDGHSLCHKVPPQPRFRTLNPKHWQPRPSSAGTQDAEEGFFKRPTLIIHFHAHSK